MTHDYHQLISVQSDLDRQAILWSLRPLTGVDMTDYRLWLERFIDGIEQHLIPITTQQPKDLPFPNESLIARYKPLLGYSSMGVLIFALF
ncbi:hypothetical protein [Photorhabdus cinerea]|uniref:Uncharacterized protein n=1 Tax=Photorhabdus cinerea TaxID=471575 RepID=A0A7X5TFY9_9GAMM|nr:hypothetical protein [Photorhabdus cinerea]NHB90813.1 hypothetical protein [Photorhabdus cinerea]